MPRNNNPEPRVDIQTALQAFKSDPLHDASVALLNTLGYNSDKRIEIADSGPEAFLELLAEHNPHVEINKDKALFHDWLSADILFQLTDEELSNEASLFKDDSVNSGLLRSYLFFAIELNQRDYARGKLTAIARQLNRVFPMPVMVFIKHRDLLSIAVINRRVNKRDTEKDVLGKVTIIRDISLANPHRGHLDILNSFSLPCLVVKTAIYNFDILHAAWEEIFNVELLNKRFYKELANWFFWALPEVSFPDDMKPAGLTSEQEADYYEKIRATGLIRLLTRLIFCWFLKEKGLIPEALFNQDELNGILKSLDDDEPSYHQAILQNLFFATLNQRMNARGEKYRVFAKDEGFLKNRNTYGVDNLYRYEALFKDPEAALAHFEDIPFLNGGLFECQDRTGDNDKKIYVDGFSRNKKKRSNIPNRFFFGEGEVNIGAATGVNRRGTEKAKGLIQILAAYKFTIVENTPIDQEIALDPELLGKVFENLLASYNEETKKNARKQTGSFYTPRSIVEYMVDESLKAHLTTVLMNEHGMTEEDARTHLDILFTYTERQHLFEEDEVDTLIKAIDTCKILDPACGSGAFPMGVLHKLVYILTKLDPDNARWKQTQLEKLDSISMREELERIFKNNNDDYGRKLYLIENCLYGVDIQPIAIQLSKLRFFISLICDQRTNKNKRQNHGIRPLPNLETKFVAADTLIGLGEKDQMELFKNPNVVKLEQELQKVRHNHFAVQKRHQKLALQRKDKELRDRLAEELVQASFADHETSLKLANWNPYDSQLSANFFEPLWMFDQSLAGGFDIIIGNPPYLNVELVDVARKAYFSEHYRTFYKRSDVFGLFFEAALTHHTSPTGVVTFIVPQQIANNLSYKKLRNLFLDNQWLKEVLYLGDKVFTAANNDVCVLFLSKKPNKSIRLVNALDFDAREVTTVPGDHFKRYSNVISFSGDERGEVIFEKVFSRDRWPIKNRFLVFQGIVTGNNAAFMPTEEQIEEANIEKSLLYPVLLGRDFEKWAIRSTDRRIIYLNSDMDIRKYPNTEKWLSKFSEKLKTRREVRRGVIPWYSLQWPRDKTVLDKAPKIIVQGTRNPRLATRIVATMDDVGIYGTQGLNFIVPKEEDSPTLTLFLLGVLNSSLMNYIYATKFLNVAIKADYLKNTPIPKVSKREKETMATLVRSLLTAKAQGEVASATFLEDLIDACVFELYFPEHIAEKDLQVLDETAALVVSIDPDNSAKNKMGLIEEFYKSANAPDHLIRNRLLRLTADSPDLLAVIKENKAV